MRLERAILALVVIIPMGCTTDPITRLDAQNDEVADVACRCYEVVGYSMQWECRTRFDMVGLTPPEQDCLRRVYAEYSVELDPMLDCAYEQGERLLNCLRPVLATCPSDRAGIDDCIARWMTDLHACPRPPEEVEAAFVACVPPRM